MNNFAFLRAGWFNSIIFLLLGISIFFCFIRCRKGQHAYRYYRIFFVGLALIRIIQLFLHMVPPRSLLGIAISIGIAIILIFSFYNFYLGVKTEKKVKSS